MTTSSNTVTAATTANTVEQSCPIRSAGCGEIEDFVMMSLFCFWLDENYAVPLELESTYEETCYILRIP